MFTVIVTAWPVLAVIVEFGENTEYQKFGVSLAVVQLELPELLLLLVKVTLGL